MKKTETVELTIAMLGTIWNAFVVVLCLILTCILGALLIPYNVSRVLHWATENACEGLAWVIGWLEELVF